MQITQGNWQARINPERGSLGFTRTEAQDLMLLAAGNTYKEIARATNRSPASVKDCLKRAYQKLGVYKATAAVAEAIDRHWIERVRCLAILAPLVTALLINGINPDADALRNRAPARTQTRVSTSRNVSRRDAGSVYA
ncbi:response regulator transcription factor [Halomonas citrativorans]|uniref:Response regulator transcription factor n=1 Tax=Halomonas citrativorans TaxID=2742612 RepID=A0ABR9F9D5_9GAMM|nr:LuxR C-terminal-related transcriptional regulator [Halomonas citrativorans]MBE0403093.1 response regulator transcription factor [Halomonas citrativorans]